MDAKRRSRKFRPTLDGLESRISLSMLAVSVVAVMDDDPGGNDSLPEPEPPPPPFPGGDPPLGWPPIPKAGPVGPGMMSALDTVPTGGSHSAPIILEPITSTPTTIIA